MNHQKKKEDQLKKAKDLLTGMPPGSTRVIFGRKVTKSTDGRRFTMGEDTVGVIHSLTLEEITKAVLS
jgi:hypothetical protein